MGMGGETAAPWSHSDKLRDFQVVENRINAYVTKFMAGMMTGPNPQRQLLISIQVSKPNTNYELR